MPLHSSSRGAKWVWSLPGGTIAGGGCSTTGGCRECGLSLYTRGRPWPMGSSAGGGCTATCASCRDASPCTRWRSLPAGTSAGGCRTTSGDLCRGTSPCTRWRAAGRPHAPGPALELLGAAPEGVRPAQRLPRAALPKPPQQQQQQQRFLHLTCFMSLVLLCQRRARPPGPPPLMFRNFSGCRAATRPGSPSPCRSSACCSAEKGCAPSRQGAWFYFTKVRFLPSRFAAPLEGSSATPRSSASSSGLSMTPCGSSLARCASHSRIGKRLRSRS